MEHPWGSSVRHTIIHYHVFRNGGLVVDRILDKNFGDGLVQLSAHAANSSICNTDLLQFLRTYPAVDAVSSYHLRPPRPEVDDFVFFDIIFLRHPLDRICVMYDGYRAQNAGGPLGQVAKAENVAGFAEKLLSEHPHLINNAQVNYLANGGRYFRPPKSSDLQRALPIIEQAALPGLAHLFDISLATAEYYFHPAFPNIDFSYVTPTPSCTTSWQLRLERLKSTCAPATYERLLEMNQLDIELVQFAEQEVNRRFQLMPDSGRRLRNLQERCRKASEYFLEYDNVDS
jgi:hypothetical protein